jgi:hypothetical protein
MSNLRPAAAIISKEQQAKPKNIGHGEYFLDQFKMASTVVTNTLR